MGPIGKNACRTGQNTENRGAAGFIATSQNVWKDDGNKGDDAQSDEHYQPVQKDVFAILGLGVGGGVRVGLLGILCHG
jgi:hypothetical protein